ncbi:BZ3500_MvSof-1268-A1-R1_Chr8-2g10179 [Microbotryum saponariae]|uniref:BZ3500_MvSof-1268-A1-R1_Chr8-2g10179 protein n=1 Tax=Microbotryum saponariae TaxID=289078 RepID=A0A2X0LZ67_9BASI|nr:BZ3500_MvSof-1268-A1-R1_Chr8-2g10179 [Microbotryum saponariae]SDA01945.1 BZ3501_MvSof-1269-A2-R1_Chr8-2g09929 [Microbotryum saponariae]
MSPVAELIVGELLAFKFTRPDLTATLTVSEFEPTFHQHQIRPNSTTRALFNKTHDLRELYASGYHPSRFDPLALDWLSNVEVNDKRDAAYIKLALSDLLVAFRTPSLQLRKVAHHVGVSMPHCSVESTESLGLVSNIVIQELFPTQASSGVFTNRNSRGQARIFFLNGHRVVSCLDTYNSSMQTVEPPAASFGFDGHTWRVLDPQAQARYYQLQSFKGVLAASLAPIRKGLAHAGEERGNADGGSGADKRSGPSQGPSGRLSKRTRR